MKRFTVALLIIHPSDDPAKISSALHLDAHFQHRAGDQRFTPRGTKLSGAHPDTRWRYVERHETDGQHFCKKIDDFLDALYPYKAFLSKLISTGGTATLIVQFLGDGYFGDTIPTKTLAKLTELNVNLGFEVFADKQR